MTTLTLRHAGETINTPSLPATMTLSDIKNQAVTHWPELTNATIVVNGEGHPGSTTVGSLSSGSVVTFNLPVGTKQ